MSAAGTVRLPAARRCLHGHRLTVRITIPRRARLRSARVTIGGRRVAVRRRGRTLIASRNLGRVRGRRVRVDVVLQVRRNGKTRLLRIRRTYRFCD